MCSTFIYFIMFRALQDIFSTIYNNNYIVIFISSFVTGNKLCRPIYIIFYTFIF